MYGKGLLVLLALVACTEVHGDAFDTARELLSGLNTTCETEIATAIESLTLLSDASDAKALAIEAEVAVNIQQTSIAFSRAVSEIRADAEEHGIDEDKINECADININKLNYLYDTVRREIDHCINITLREGNRIIARDIEHLDTNRNRVAYMDLQIRQCELTPGDESCIYAVIEEILLEDINLPSRIKEDTARTTAVVTALDSTFDECSEDRIGTISAMGEQYIADLKDCVGLSA